VWLETGQGAPESGNFCSFYVSSTFRDISKQEEFISRTRAHAEISYPCGKIGPVDKYPFFCGGFESEACEMVTENPTRRRRFVPK
jgi:hypothetical protein